MELNNNNIEEQILLLADGELDTPAAEAVLAYIGQHAECQAMLDAYLSVKMLPEEDIAFPDKESLLREMPLTMSLKPQINTRAWRWAAAAALLLIAGVTAALLLQQPDHKAEPAVAVALKKNAVLPSVTQGSLIARANDKEQNHSRERRKDKVLQKVPDNTPKQNPVSVVELPQEREKETVPVLATVGEHSLPVAADPVAVQERKEAIVPVAQEPTPSWSPLKEETMQGVNELVAQVRTFREDVRQKTQLLKRATIVLRLGDKEIALNK